MKTEKEKIDALIKETLSQEEAKFYDELEERNLFGKINETFKGKTGWLVVVMNIVNLFLFVLFIYSIIQFFDTDGTNEMIKWAMAIFACFACMAYIKLYVWMQMDKNDVLRELKRLELQVAALSHKLDK